MQLNRRRHIEVIADNRCIPVECYITKEEVRGQHPAPGKVWLLINFIHPETKHIERLRVQESETILESPDEEIQSFIEREVECFFRHCDEEVRSKRFGH